MVDQPAPSRPAVPPLLPWAVGLIIGIAADSVYPLDPLACALVVSSAAITFFIRRLRLRAAAVFALVAAAATGAILHHREFRQLPAGHVVTFAPADRDIARITGRVVSRPNTYHRGYEPFEPWLFQTDRTSFVMEAEAIETTRGPAPVCGKVRVSVKEAALAVSEGARVEAFGWLSRPRSPRNPGQFDWDLFNARRGVHVRLTCDSAENVRVLNRGAAGSSSVVTRLRNHIRRLLLDERLEVGDESVSMLDAMILGRRSGMDREVERSFVETGCAHYLAASGIHVGILAFAIWLPARVLGVRRSRAAVVVMFAVVGYALLADPRPPIMRATVMTCALCLAILARRRRSVAGSLCLAAIIILVVDPLSLFDIGFQLSFISVIGIVYLAPVADEQAGKLIEMAWSRFSGGGRADPEIDKLLTPWDQRYWWLHSVRRASRMGLCVALTAWVCSLPIVAAGFGRIAPGGWLNSFVAFPLVGCVMIVGFLKIIVGAAVPVLSGAVDGLLNVLAHALLSLMAALQRLPNGTVVHVPPPPWWLCAAHYAALLGLLAWSKKWITHRAACGTVALLILVAGVWWGGRGAPPGVRITQLAVGRGTSTVIELPDGQVWLYDTGASGSFDPGQGIVVPYLHHRGIRRVDGVIISHPNLDHFGGLPAVIDAVDCGPVYVSPLFDVLSGPRTPGRALLSALQRRSHPVRVIARGARFDLGNDVRMDVLWPTEQTPLHIGSNDSSIVLRLTCGDVSVLFTGDVSFAAQQWLLRSADPSADVLMLPHHGAVVANSAAFLRAVGADCLIRSSFVPNAESAELLRLVGDTPMHNTAETGAVTVLLDGSGVRVADFAIPHGR